MVNGGDVACKVAVLKSEEINKEERVSAGIVEVASFMDGA